MSCENIGTLHVFQLIRNSPLNPLKYAVFERVGMPLSGLGIHALCRIDGVSNYSSPCCTKKVRLEADGVCSHWNECYTRQLVVESIHRSLIITFLAFIVLNVWLCRRRSEGVPVTKEIRESYW